MKYNMKHQSHILILSMGRTITLGFQKYYTSKSENNNELQQSLVTKLEDSPESDDLAYPFAMAAYQ